MLILGHDSNLYLATLVIIIAYLIFERRVSNPPTKIDYLVRTSMFSIGCTVDWLFAKFELIQFSSDNTMIPFWLVLMWMLFSVTFKHCYNWLQHKTLLAATLGSIFGPLAYWAASRMSSVEIISPITFTISSLLFWSINFMYFSYLNKNS